MATAATHTFARSRVRFTARPALLTIAALAALVTAAGAGGAPSGHTPITISGAPTSPVQTSLSVDGAAGARIVAGRFTIVVPPGAFSGVATISLAVPNQSILECTVNLPSASLALPVELDCDASNSDTPSPFDLTLATFDPLGHQWSPIAGSSEDASAIVRAPLRTSSTCSVQGKAGW